MYITVTEYNTLTGRPAAEATTERLMIACKLLDARIGNYTINADGYKLFKSGSYWYASNPNLENYYNCCCINGLYYIKLSNAKIDAVKLWTAKMISYLTDNNNNPPSSQKNIKLGRFSIGNNAGAATSNNLIPDEMGYADSILITSGIINRKIYSR